MDRGAACRRIVLGVLVGLIGLGAVADSALGLTLRGRRANNTIVVRASGVASGSYSINGGRWVRFARIRTLTIDGVGGRDVCRIVNPAGGLFAPAGGITCNGGNRTGGPRRGVLGVSGGRATGTSYSPRRGHPGAGTMTARLGPVVQVIRFSGVKPLTDTVPAPFVFNDPAANDVAELVDGPSQGMDTIQSRTDQFPSVSITNQASVTINALQPGDSARLDVNQPETGMQSLDVESGGEVLVHQAILPGVQLTLASTADQVLELGPIVLGQQALSVTAGTRVSLVNPGNVVAGFSAVAHGGSVSFSNDNVDGLDVGAVSAAQDVALVNAAGAVIVSGAVSGGSSSGVTLTSRQGESMISLSGGGSLTGQDVALTANTMTLAGGSIHASSVAVLAPFSAGLAIDLGDTVDGQLSLLSADLAAITAGGLTIGAPNAGQITVTEPISESGVLTLETAGGLTRTSAGALSAPLLGLLNGGAIARTWTVTPTSVADGSGFSIPYTTGTLTLAGGSAGDQFNVTAAPNTHFVIDGGPLSNGTLHYDAQGRPISGAALAAPSGEIDSPTVKPVTFTDMAAVNITHAATVSLAVSVGGTGTGTVTTLGSGQIHCPSVCSHSFPVGSRVTLSATPTSGSRFTGWSGAGCSGTTACSVTLTATSSIGATFTRPPRCVLRAASSTVSHPRSAHLKRGRTRPTTLALRANCDQPAKATVAGTITEVLRPGTHHRKPLLKTVRIPPTRASLSARRTTSLTVTIPTAAATALAAHIPESASITLTATNKSGTGRVSLKLRRLAP
jgi:hypothetical protein